MYVREEVANYRSQRSITQLVREVIKESIITRGMKIIKLQNSNIPGKKSMCAAKKRHRSNTRQNTRADIIILF